MVAKILQGIVVSNKMQSTVVVSVARVLSHPLYKKRVRSSKKYKAHCEQVLAVGDAVLIQECAPYSKTKSWRVIS